MSVISVIENKFKKPHVVDVRSGDTVRVHQKIREGNKERVQVFEGLVIRTKKANSHTANITVRRVASGIGVEKTYLVHSPLVTKVEIVKRSKVRRNYLSYMRDRTGKAARMTGVDFDRNAVNFVPEVAQSEKPKAESEEAPAEKPADEDKKEETKAEKPTDESKVEVPEDQPKADSEKDEKLEAEKEDASAKEPPSK